MDRRSTATLRFDECSPVARIISVRIVPYREVVTVDDGQGRYQETFLPGAFRDQVEQAKAKALRIWLTCEHKSALDDVVGHCVELRDLPAGLYGAFRVWDGAKGDEALARVRDGVYTGVSMEALTLRSRTVHGVTQRQRAHLDTVSLGRRPAYTDANVLSIRKGLRDDQPGPASPAELRSWDLDRMERALSALACKCIDQSTRGSYTRDLDYQLLLRQLEEIAEERAELEQSLHPQPDPAIAEALRPRILRRNLSGPITVR
jgi:HK97 family phage prohead protease